MISISVQAPGVDQLLTNLKDFGNNTDQILDEMVGEAGDELVKLIQALPPVNVQNYGYDALGIPVAPKFGGTMRQTVHSSKPAQKEREVGPDTDYSDYVILGTVKMQARNFLKWALENFGGLEKVEEVAQRVLNRHFRA